MTLRDALVAAVRTAAAALAAFIITWLVQQGWDFPDDVDAQINVAVFLAVTAAYNLLVNWLATKVHPAFGYLLLVPKAPAYAPSAALKPSEAPVVVGEVVVVDDAEPPQHPEGGNYSV